MVSVLADAHAALKIAGDVTGKKSDLTDKEGESFGRRFRHWSHYVLIVGAVGGAVVAVVASIISMIPLAIVGGLFCLTNAIGAYYVGRFDQFKDLEGYVSELAASIKEMDGYIKQYKFLNQELKEVGDGMESNLHEAKKVWDEGSGKVEKQEERIAQLEAQLEATMKKEKTWETLYVNLHNALDGFSHQVVGLGQNAGEINEAADEIARQFADSKAVVEAIHKGDEEMDDNNEMYEKLNQANISNLSNLQKELEKMIKMGKDASQIIDDKGKSQKEFKGTVDEMAEERKKIAELLEKERKANEKSSQAMKEAGEMAQAMRQVTATIKDRGASKKKKPK